MSGIGGFFHRGIDITKDITYVDILNKMNEVQKHRGMAGSGIYQKKGCGLAHVAFTPMDQVSGHQPMEKQVGEREFAIAFDGEIYNIRDLREELKQGGAELLTSSDTEVLLQGYIQYGIDYLKRLNGVFAGAIWDNKEEILYLFRDRLGVKPLFYTKIGDSLVFSSEIKGLFAYPNVEATIDRDGLCEIFAVGPAKTLGKGVFKNIEEVLPGHIVAYRQNDMGCYPYWELQSREHTDSMEETVEKVAWLIEDAVKLQMDSDLPICTLLSGGLDSSLVTAICAEEKKKKGEILDTFSFDFQENAQYFKSNDFQPSEDRPWVEKMVAYSRTNHKILECSNEDLIKNLYQSVDGRDLPCMADVESSLLYFCKEVAKTNKIALTGECADEVFGGYPWFHKQEYLECQEFPWSRSMEPRQDLLSDPFLRYLPMQEYAHNAYEKTRKETPTLYGESPLEARKREIAYINLKWAMVTLLDRMERSGAQAGMGARVPFADYRLVEYVFNVPWEMKSPGGLVKGLLRKAGERHLPYDVVYRKKSPFPKTYHPEYEKRLAQLLQEVLKEKDAPIRAFLDKKKLETWLENPSDYGKPWYGQLMARPQMLAYLLQMNYWFKKYNVKVQI